MLAPPGIISPDKARCAISDRLRLWNSTRVGLNAALSVFKTQRERIDRLEAALMVLTERSAEEE